MLPGIASKYYRLIRWMSYLQALLGGGHEKCIEKRDNGHGHEKGDKEIAAFVPAVFNFAAIEAALDGKGLREVTEKKVKEKEVTAAGKKSKQQSNSTSKQQSNSTPNQQSNPIALHPLARVDLRVGKIVKVERHPNADRLYVEQVDLGEAEPRIVVSGLVEHVPMEELQERLCIFICNLKPAALCKVTSSAMLLVAKDDTGKLEPLIPPTTSVAGDRVSINGVIPQPDEVIKAKDSTWEVVRQLLSMKNGVAHYENEPLLVSGKGNVISNKISSGIIS